MAFGDAARFWIKLGFINFGGPTGQIAIMHQEMARGTQVALLASWPKSQSIGATRQ